MDQVDFGELALFWAKRSTCLRRKYACIIVDSLTKHIISTGINGAPTGQDHCTDKQWCLREELHIPRGERYECCCSLHSEQNAIIRAGMNAVTGADMYIAGIEVSTNLPVVKPLPCFLCTKMIINARIGRVFLYNGKNIIEVDIQKLYNQYIQDLFAQMEESKLNIVNTEE